METDAIKQKRVFGQNILFSQGVPLKSDETIEDLQRDGLRLIQKKHGFRFGSDSVLLAAYAASLFRAPDRRRFLLADLGAGCGAVTILLAARFNSARIIGLEKDPASFSALQRNVFLNDLGDRVFPVQLDLRFLEEKKWPLLDLPPAACDLVVGNPPYLKPGQALPTAEPSSAREEIDLPLASFMHAAARLLKAKGRLVLVQRPHRLADVLEALAGAGLTAKSLRFIHPLPGRAPHAFLLSALREGKPGGLKVEAPLVLAEQAGVPSREISDLYGNAKSLTPAELERGLIRED